MYQNLHDNLWIQKKRAVACLRLMLHARIALKTRPAQTSEAARALRLARFKLMPDIHDPPLPPVSKRLEEVIVSLQQDCRAMSRALAATKHAHDGEPYHALRRFACQLIVRLAKLETALDLLLQ